MVTGPWFFGPPCPPPTESTSQEKSVHDGVADITLPSENPKLSGGGCRATLVLFRSFSLWLSMNTWWVTLRNSRATNEPESNLHGLNYWAYPNYGSNWCTHALTNNSGTKWVCLKIGDPAFDGLSSCLLLKWPFCGLFPVSHDRPKFDQRPNSQYSSML
jgi:hypothetical protein